MFLNNEKKKTYLYRWKCEQKWFSVVNNYPSSVHNLVFVIFAADGFDGNGLKLEKIGHFFKFFLCILAKMLKTDL